MSRESENISTVCLHTEAPAAAWAGGPARHLSPPITLSSSFLLPAGQEVPGEPCYGRYGNPGRAGLEAVLARLEQASHCLTFRSVVW